MAGAIKSGHHWKDMTKRGSLCNVYWDRVKRRYACKCECVTRYAQWRTDYT